MQLPVFFFIFSLTSGDVGYLYFYRTGTRIYGEEVFRIWGIGVGVLILGYWVRLLMISVLCNPDEPWERRCILLHPPSSAAFIVMP